MTEFNLTEACHRAILSTAVQPGLVPEGWPRRAQAALEDQGPGLPELKALSNVRAIIIIIIIIEALEAVSDVFISIFFCLSLSFLMPTFLFPNSAAPETGFSSSV